MMSKKVSFPLILANITFLYFALVAISQTTPLEANPLPDFEIPLQFDNILNPGNNSLSREWHKCAAGDRPFSKICKSLEQFRGTNRSQYMEYKVAILNSFNQTRRVFTCCFGLGASQNGTEIYRSIGCIARGFISSFVYWGNFSGYPGITCKTTPFNSTSLEWKYKPIILRQ